MQNKLRRLFFLWGILCLIILTGCLPAKSESKDPNRVQIYTTLYPLAFFAKEIGEDHVQVTNLIPTGTDSHDFEPTAKDLTNLSEADLFIYNGAGLEPWVTKIHQVIDHKKTQKLDASGQIKLLTSEQHTAKHSHGEIDPHVWLDPQLAKKQAFAIKTGLIKQDSKNQADYEANYQLLASELDKLDKEFTTMVTQAKKKQFVTSHDAFSYLADHYGLEQIAITGLSPSDQPSAKKIEQVIKTMQKHQLKYIFFETLVNPSVAKTVQAEAQVEALVLHPLEGLTKQEVSAGEDYFSLMRENKQNLAKALESK